MSATVSLTSGLEHLSRNMSDNVPKIAALAKANFDLMISDNSPIENINGKYNFIKNKKFFSLNQKQLYKKTLRDCVN